MGTNRFSGLYRFSGLFGGDEFKFTKPVHYCNNLSLENLNFLFQTPVKRIGTDG